MILARRPNHQIGRTASVCLKNSSRRSDLEREVSVISEVRYVSPLQQSVRLEATSSQSRKMIDGDCTDVLAMQAMARGRRDALTVLYQRYGRLAYALALRAVNESGIAEEIVQEAFIALWRSAEHYREDRCSPRAWLMTIVRNRSIDELRRRGREPQRSEIDADQPSAIEDDPWPEVWKFHCADKIRGALEGLPPEQRNVIELAFFGGLTHAEIALRLGTPLGTIKKRMRTGLQRLRAALNDAFSDSKSR